MLKALEEFNRTRAAENQAPIRIGIGINTGNVITGAIGSTRALQYTAIGDAMNVALAPRQRRRDAARSSSPSTTYRHVAGRVEATAAAAGEGQGQGGGAQGLPRDRPALGRDAARLASGPARRTREPRCCIPARQRTWQADGRSAAAPPGASATAGFADGRHALAFAVCARCSARRRI